MSADAWYYASGSQQIGPVTTDVLRQLIGSGQVRADDLVWSDGMANWAAAGSMGALSDVLRIAPAPAPGAGPAWAPTYPPVSGAAPGAYAPGSGLNYYTPPTAVAGRYAEYAGFWIRFGAWIIDFLVTIVASAFAGMLVGGIIGGVMGASGPTSPAEIRDAVTWPARIAGSVVTWLYAHSSTRLVITLPGGTRNCNCWNKECFGVGSKSGTARISSINCTVSAKQATLGKMAVGIYVTNERGERIGFGRATARYVASILSALILGIGYLMVAFTDRKQGLHDMIAGTLVFKR